MCTHNYTRLYTPTQHTQSHTHTITQVCRQITALFWDGDWLTTSARCPFPGGPQTHAGARLAEK